MKQKQYRGLIGRVARVVGFNYEGEAEGAPLMYLTVIILIAPLLAIALSLPITNLLYLSPDAYIWVFGGCLVVTEVVCVTILYKAVVLAESEDFQNVVVEEERQKEKKAS